MDSLKLYVHWMKENALPVWSTLGFDAKSLRFCERLDNMGAPLAVPHRAMVQARQIFVFSRAQQLGWCDTGALAEGALFSLMRDFGTETTREAHFAYSISTEGQIVSDVADAYTHAFVLFAIAAFYELDSNPRLLQLADKVNAFVKHRLVDADHGGLFDTYPATDHDKRQNPLMHLVEAYLALARVSGESRYLDDATALITLFTQRLFKSGDDMLFERFAQDWSPHRGIANSSVFEPGHHFEWVWLLHEYERLSGKSLGDAPARLHETALHSGMGRGGLIYDELDANKQVVKNSHRVWPHTEAIKAASARFRTGDAHAVTLGNQSAQALLEHFLNRPFYGGWIDHIDDQHNPIVNYVPASSLYHLFFAASEAAQSFDAEYTMTKPAEKSDAIVC